eukprot:g25399.t1
MPGEGERVLFLGAEGGVARPAEFAADIVSVQPFRPLFRSLGENAYREPDGQDYDGALVLCGKHRGDNEDRVAEALARVKPGGMIVIAGAKEDGIQPLRNTLLKLGIVLDYTPKYHGVAVWFARPDDAAGAIKALRKSPVTVEGRFQAAPGMFSHDRIDPGSELLASRLPTDFDGNAADFGAGWGYLSVMLAEKSQRVNRIDLFEADYRALEAAKQNIADNCPDLEARFFWQDLGGEPPKEKYDLVIMNPPFHEAQAADPELGKAMIRTASAALRQGGRLMLVANRGLPYEPVLAEGFREHGETCRNAKFKILPDVFGFQEAWHAQSLRQALAASGLEGEYDLLVPPGATGQRIVCAAIVRKDLLTGEPDWIVNFPDKFVLRSSGDDPQTEAISVDIASFSRPVLHFTIKPHDAHEAVHVYVCHFKSKAPTRLDHEEWYKAEKPVYGKHATSIGAAISTIRRTAEAAALRFMLTEQMKGTRTSVVVLGDVNDGQLSNTANILTGQPRFLVGDSLGGGDTALYTAQTLQEYRSTRDIYYTHIHQDMMESLDHIFVSEEFYDNSRRRIWMFDGLTINNDHLHFDDHKVSGTNDHGIVCAAFKYKPMKSEAEAIAADPVGGKLAAHYFRLAADRGNAAAAYKLGEIYENGWGFAPDLFQAFYWYMKAAARNDKHGQLKVGWCYQKGIAVQADPRIAAIWYRTAADNDNVWGYHMLAFMLADGEGLPRDVDLARQYFELSLPKTGDHWAKWKLAHLIAAENPKRARALLKEAAAAGNAQAAEELGRRN